MRIEERKSHVQQDAWTAQTRGQHLYSYGAMHGLSDRVAASATIDAPSRNEKKSRWVSIKQSQQTRQDDQPIATPAYSHCQCPEHKHFISCPCCNATSQRPEHIIPHLIFKQKVFLQLFEFTAVMAQLFTCFFNE